MDRGHYGPQQGWENNSALEGYGAVHDSYFRAGDPYDDRRYVDDRFSRDDAYPRGDFHRDILERDSYPPPPPPVGMWPQTRRRNYEEEYSFERDYRRHEKPPARYGERERDDYSYDDYDFRSRFSRHSREDSLERDFEHGRHSYDSDYDRGNRRESNWRRRESREREHDNRDLSRERDESPYRRHDHSRSRSRSHGRDDRARSRSPRGRSHGRSLREDSYDDGRHGRSGRRSDHEDRRLHDHYSVAPSATVVVKGLSQKTTEEDLYQILVEWGPLRNVRVIKERNSVISRGFAFIDFPSVDAAQAMMTRLGDEGLLVDGRNLFFEYSSKPTGGVSGPLGTDHASRSGHVRRSITVPSDWMCTICGCVNFARRTSCFQCNEPRMEDAPPADMTSSNPTSIGKRGEIGPTHVLVVRGLDENADEEMLRYEFSKHAPLKDLRLVRDKFTHVSRGFAFVHFHSVEDATKALEATNGTTLEKNGQILRVAYAKSIIGGGSATPGASQSSSLAAAAIEAATFAQQYDAVGWTPKEYNPDDKQSADEEDQGRENTIQKDPSAPRSGFVWDEASGYYYDAASGFYYDGNAGLYYDGNNGIWYTYDHQTQQYIPCADQNDKTAEKQSETSKASDGPSSKKVIISAPAATITSNEKAASLPDTVQAAAAAAMAAEKKEKEKLKEIRLASKSSILANKKKMSNVLTMWKQRSNEGQAPRVALDDNQPSAAVEERFNTAPSTKSKFKSDVPSTKENSMSSSGFTTNSPIQSAALESVDRARPVISGSSGSLKGVIRSSGMGVVKSDTLYTGSTGGASTSSTSTSSVPSSLTFTDASITVTPFRTDASALGSYASSVAAGSGKRRFSEMPSSALSNREQTQTTYRDRAAERRSLYGSSSSFGDDQSDVGDSNRDSTFRRGALDSMPFPPGVGGGRVAGDANSQNYEVITADRAIDETNVGNRMLRSMGWHEGSGLGKDRSGMVEPVQAQAMDTRAGLGSQPKKLDPKLEVQAGDSYKAVIQKKAIARFREMS
ncbi:SUPPRESSOR OF ABI3-5-like isoform X1 [Olea europaea subsp. europaea]|uniref:SUPPRESSOR OF ABI3-5-like isoform X1 n=2 Tax=Olea europaea subsp. europaea TaxID=158383 RepID=A0A8S0TA02_OLEEU|nr:SUPPRESSOR OF ABI3-5-like isoform X1 [Olea europaea subsp. europaea]